MICGINYGFSREDEEAEQSGNLPVVELPSFFSDETIRQKDLFRRRVIKWLTGWGVPLARRPGDESSLDRSFFQCNWLDTQTRGVTGSDKVTLTDLVRDSDGFLDLLERRKPSVVFLFGSSLIEALNDIRVRDRVVQALGNRTSSQRFIAEMPGYKGINFGVRVQQFGNTVVVGCPHPQARGLSDAYMTNIALPSCLLDKLHSR